MRSDFYLFITFILVIICKHNIAQISISKKEQVFYRAIDSLNNLSVPIQKRNEDYKNKDYSIRDRCGSASNFQNISSEQYLRNVIILDSIGLVPIKIKEIIMYNKQNIRDKNKK